MIDFAVVKTVTIPQGEVVSLSCGNKELWKRINLPQGYQAVEYLESSATVPQWIDTGIHLRVGGTKDGAIPGRCEMVAEVAYPDAYPARRLMGGTGDVTDYFGLTANGTFEHGAAYEVCNPEGPIPITYGTKYRVKATKYAGGEISGGHAAGHILEVWDGQTWFGMSSNPTYTGWADQNMGVSIFRLTNFNNYYSYATRVYSFRIFIEEKVVWGTGNVREKNELVWDGVPCLRESDGKPGMYDLVSGAFFTNAGSGEFAYRRPAGAD